MSIEKFKLIGLNNPAGEYKVMPKNYLLKRLKVLLENAYSTYSFEL
ncbi:hypothetical protein CYANOKiyG1_56070 [Okeania sp. KiyG1]|nr:hypothetical protein CYANOKiyG1_56070 [Okeania sp. KiyG1]